VGSDHKNTKQAAYLGHGDHIAADFSFGLLGDVRKFDPKDDGD
jgi:hypothetical protein